MNLSKEQDAAISDRRRLWEVRKYCQVKSALGRNKVGGGKPSKEPQSAGASPPDTALSSILQLLADRLGADIAMASLLDEETQFFLAGAGRDNNEPAVESARWFGCDQVSYHGGLCERTITVDRTQHPAIYEELDMSENPRTRDLPYVDGTLANFRHYAGAPVETAAGIPIGTVFIMSRQSSSGLRPSQQQLLIDTAENVMRQLTLTLQALDGERLMQFQSATAALLQRQRPFLHQQGLPRKQSVISQQPNYVVEVYQHAADVMRRSLELEGVFFQHVSADSQTSQATSDNWQDSMLAASLNTESSHPICFSRSEVNKIIRMFPHGAVLHRLHRDWLMSDSEERRPLEDLDIEDALNKSFQSTQQLLIMPLFDVLHNRTAAICVGWLSDYTRVYSNSSDIPFVSAFCMSAMSEVLRLETQMLERVKSDFLGSISHEMKTPLHQTPGNLELLLQTSCSVEQYDLAVNARFGATQLLETIDKILLYSSISSEPNAKPESFPKTDMVLDEKKAPQIIGPRIEHVASAGSTVDLVRMCEEVVEDTTKRMRLLETIMSPSEQPNEEQDGVLCSDPSVQRKDGTEEDPFTIVVFDASPIENVQVPRNTGLRIVLENLLSNAIKFTRAGCCARVCLRFSSGTVELIVSDCGYGMSEDFVRHNIYLPFAQQDPVASGTGLGLSLVKHSVDSLGGTVDIETDQASGTTATISLWTRDLVAETDTHLKADSKSQIPAGIIPSMPKRPKDSLPVMHACFYAPSTWLHRYDKRDERSIDLVFDSLSSTLGEWYQPVLSLWQRQKKHIIPDLIFISQRNLAEFKEECGEEFANVKKVVICAAIGKNSSQDRERIRQASTVADALITGAVLPSKLWEVVTSYFPRILQPEASAVDQTRNNKNTGIRPKSLDFDESREAVKEQKKDSDSLPRNVLPEHDLENEQSSYNHSDKQVPDDERTGQVAAVGSEIDEKKDVEAGVNATSGDEGAAYRPFRTLSTPTMDASKAILEANSTVPILQRPAQPHLLLVDDNNINLKMLGMFVSKCGIPAAQSTSVPGGQEAIEAFKAFGGGNNTAKGFDIILMDLSMPEVSGFDATSAIRQAEKASDHGHRAYIVALTGLVSDKDRSAAYEAGVDDYVTKPAGLQKVRDSFETWQRRRHNIDRISN